MSNSLRLVLLAIAGTALLSGCASVRQDSQGFDASRVDPFVELNKTTLQDVRALLGTPTTMATARKDGARVVGYGISGHNAWGSFGRNFGKSAMTLGLGAQTYEYTIKNVLFKINADGVVTDYRKNGASYVTKQRFTFWNECEREMTDEEVNSPVYYGQPQICSLYASETAAREGIAAKDVDTGREFTFCNIPCQVQRGLVRAFGEIEDATNLVPAEPNDGSRSAEIFN